MTKVNEKTDNEVTEGSSKERSPGKDDGGGVGEGGDHIFCGVLVDAPPGKLGLSVQFVEGIYGAVVTAVHPSCSFGDRVKVGDRLVLIDETVVLAFEHLSVNSGRRRKVGFTSTHPEATPVVAPGEEKAFQTSVAVHGKAENKFTEGRSKVAEPGPGEDDGGDIEEDEDHTFCGVSVVAPPGKLGLSVQFVEGVEGAVVASVHGSCPFKDKVKVGDRLVLIDETVVLTSEHLLVNSDRHRKVGFIPLTNSEAAPVMAAARENETQPSRKVAAERVPPKTSVVRECGLSNAKSQRYECDDSDKESKNENKECTELDPSSESEHQSKAETCKYLGCSGEVVSGGVCFRHNLEFFTRKYCSQKGCNHRAQQNGRCWGHGAKRECKHEGCAKKAVRGGVCLQHGATAKLCTHEGCVHQSRKGGVCWTHGANETLKHRRCSYEGCSSRAKQAGLCVRHCSKSKCKWAYCKVEGCSKLAAKGGVCIRHGATDVRKMCSFEGCVNQSRKGGVCARHGAISTRCSHEECNNKAVKGGVCKRHGATVEKKRCSNEGCNNQAVKHGVCIRHGAHRLGN